MPADITLKDISFRYTHHTLIDHLNLSLPKGKSVLLSGPSGSGKTTLLRIMGGILRPTEGTIYFGNHPISDKNRTEDYGFSFVDNDFFEEMNLEENISIFPNLNHITIDPDWYKELLEIFEMTDLTGVPVSKLSAGQRERVGLMRAFIHKPTVLILDEPGSHLDPRLQEKLGKFLEDYQKAYNATLIVSSHGGINHHLFHIFLHFHEDSTLSIQTDTHA